jgi:processive 1,2-diacylglycerol beta-glucosyltransferase
VVLTGSNRKLLAWFHARHFRHRVAALGYTEDVHKLMGLATLLVSKPGGLTTSEALAKHLPIVIVNPIPGQEAYNARFLLSLGGAVQATIDTVRQTVRDLLDNPEQLELMRSRNAEVARPYAARDISRLLLALGDRYRELAPLAAEPDRIS